MFKKLEAAKNPRSLLFLFVVVYVASYMTRINYGAVISEMERDTGISRALLSMAVTGSFITYGAGQIVSGFCGDKFSPKALLLLGLLLSSGMNLLIPLAPNPYIMLVIWCINGFAQAFMWPPLVRIMLSVFTQEKYKTASVRVTWGGSIGTIIVYLLSPVFIAVSGWRAVFFFSAICGFVMAAIWQIKGPKVQVKPAPVQNDRPAPSAKGSMAALFSPVMLLVMLAITLQGMLRDGVTTWMPSYIGETYSLGSAVSILTGVLMPVFAIVSLSASSKLYQKKFENPVACSGVLFCAGALGAFMLTLFNGKNAALSVVFTALLTGSMHGTNLILICMVPAYFIKYGNVSTVSGVLNSFTYVGSAVSTYGIALVSENAGWNVTLLMWLGIALAGAAICLLCARPWARKFMQN